MSFHDLQQYKTRMRSEVQRNLKLVTVIDQGGRFTDMECMELLGA